LNLREEISQVLKLPNFVTILCQSYESGNRQRVFQTSPMVPEEIGLPNISSLLGLSLAEAVTFAFCLMHSQNKFIAHHATQFFKSRLPEVSSFRDLSENAANTLNHFLATTEVSQWEKFFYLFFHFLFP
jgi:hypothetical protein